MSSASAWSASGWRWASTVSIAETAYPGAPTRYGKEVGNAAQGTRVMI
jgi:hypothetical protein